jgi:cytochrome c2
MISWPPRVLVMLLTLAGSACAPRESLPERVVVGGDSARGVIALGQHGCGTCHVIPGVIGARGVVGPSLRGVAGRPYLAGTLPNNSTNLIRWIRDPRSIEPRTMMPVLGVTEAEARDIAAYLYTLDDGGSWSVVQYVRRVLSRPGGEAVPVMTPIR